MATTTLVTGGQRSGKSRFAESLALKSGTRPVYLATARVEDEEFSQRVALHRERRDDRWLTIEEPVNIDTIEVEENAAVLIDCITLWLTNIFFAHNEETFQSLECAKMIWERLTARNITLIAVTNEIGMGIIPETAMGRRFVDLQGWMNQHIAQKAEEVYLLVSGIPVQIK